MDKNYVVKGPDEEEHGACAVVLAGCSLVFIVGLSLFGMAMSWLWDRAMDVLERRYERKAARAIKQLGKK